MYYSLIKYQLLPANTPGTASWYYGLRETSSRNGHQRGESRFSPLETPSCKVQRESLIKYQLLPANTPGTASWYYGLRETSSRNGHQRGESRFSPLETPSCKVQRESLIKYQLLPANTPGTASWYYGLRETSSRNGHQRGESRFSPLETPSCKVQRESLIKYRNYYGCSDYLNGVVFS